MNYILALQHEFEQLQLLIGWLLFLCVFEGFDNYDVLISATTCGSPQLAMFQDFF